MSIPFSCSSNSFLAHTAPTNFNALPSRAKCRDSNFMKRILLTLFFLITLTLSAHAKLKVVATLPDLASISREVGGDKIEVGAMAKPTEDSHFVDARPSFVVQLRDADVLIDGGAELEIGWLPPLLQNARNPKIEVGKPGRVQAYQGVRLMNVPTSATRAAGDVHALGNPHFVVRSEEHTSELQSQSNLVCRLLLEK